MLFIAEDERLENENIIKLKTTDSTGEVKFDFVKHDYYYVKVNHDQLGEALDEVSTPNKAVSFLEIIYQ